MKTCKECLHYEICDKFGCFDRDIGDNVELKICKEFNGKAKCIKKATSKMKNSIVYPNLKVWMEYNGINTRMLAKLIGCPITTLYGYLEGKTESLKLIRKIKKVTGLKWSDLIND